MAVAACGGGNEPANTGPKAASLDGDRNDSAFQFEDAVDVKQAPTTTHGALAKLLPKSALDKNSVKYGGWDAVACSFSTEAPENAALPVVAADYKSAGAKIVTDTESKCGSAEIEYPQQVKLIFIRAPEAMAAQPIADALIAALDAKGFNELDDLYFTGGREDNEPIKRFGRVTPAEETDDVYVAYVKVVGDLVIYALESEVAPKLPGPGGAQMARLNEGGRGTRVGAQLIALALTRRQAP
ncbi:MAG: hypothetical protein H6839_01220 [Planctomycetes bacterium]|nr:hypothetical protein [Planctomycetota bacterium]